MKKFFSLTVIIILFLGCVSTPSNDGSSMDKAIELTQSWTSGEIAAAGGEQWFKITAKEISDTEDPIDIQFESGSLTGVRAQVFSTDGTALGNGLPMSGSSNFDRRAGFFGDGIETATVYYIRVTPSNDEDKGTYRIRQFSE